MRIFDHLRKQREPDPPEYDPRAHRAEIAESLARELCAGEPQLEIGRVAHAVVGPLGGESSRFVVTERVAGQNRRFIVSVRNAGR